MKTRDFLLGMLACFSLVACSSEDVVDNGTKEFKDKAYMRVQIAMAGNSSGRATAGDYAYGTDEEQTVNNVRFLFYDVNGKFMTEGEAVTSTAVTDNSEGEKYWEAESAPIISLKLEEGKPFPTQVVAYVNIGTTFDFGDDNRTIANDGKKVAESPSLAPAAFVMTTSTYVDGENKVVCSTPVSPENFHETEAAAKADANLVTIHVERLPAKVSVTEATGIDIEEIPDASGNLLKFSVTGFALNGINTSSYLQKQVDAGWGQTGGALASWDEWTIPTDFRCFWAKDMNYAVATEPTDLTFFKYNELENDDVHITKDAKYCYENTFELPLTSDGNKNLFKNATHVLVFGKYQIKWKDESDYVALTEDFYMYAGTAYLRDGLKGLWANAITDVFKDDTGGKADIGCYELVSDGTVDGVTLQLRDDVTVYKKGDGGVYTSMTTDERTAKNTALKGIYKATGYKNAVGYFPVLIEHFGVPGADAAAYDNTTELGVVRNHIYNIEIQSIKSLAEGVFNDDVAIIPDSSVKTYYLASKLRILSWKTVSQSVEL